MLGRAVSCGSMPKILVVFWVPRRTRGLRNGQHDMNGKFLSVANSAQGLALVGKVYIKLFSINGECLVAEIKIFNVKFRVGERWLA